MTVDYDRLRELRKITKLNIIERMKLRKLILIAVEKKNLINSLEHCEIAADTKEADAYEYQRRLKKYNRDRRNKCYGKTS